MGLFICGYIPYVNIYKLSISAYVNHSSTQNAQEQHYEGVEKCIKPQKQIVVTIQEKTFHSTGTYYAPFMSMSKRAQKAEGNEC